MSLFGRNMFTSGRDYKLVRKLKSLDDSELVLLDNRDRLRIIRETIKENIHKQYEKSSLKYEKGARITRFIPGQEVFQKKFRIE